MRLTPYLLGVETEVNDSQEVQEMELANGLTDETAPKAVDGAVETKGLMGMADSPSEVEGNMLPDVSPPSYLPRNGVGTTPFTTKQVKIYITASHSHIQEVPHC